MPEYLACWSCAMEVSESSPLKVIQRTKGGELLPPSERVERTSLKRKLLLRFLRINLFTSAEIAGLLIGVKSRQGIHTTLLALEKDELLRREVFEINGRRWTLWGITSHGQAFAFDPDLGEIPESKYFEHGRVGLSVLAHTLDIQRLSIIAAQFGWTNWQLGDRIEKWQAGQSRPDVIVKAPSGCTVALECERTIKTAKRYQVVLSDRLQAMKRGEFARCIWLCPTQDLANRLKMIITAIKYVSVAGTQVAIQERHHSLLCFAAYSDFPLEMDR